MSKLLRKTKAWASMALAVCLLAGSACLPGMTVLGEEEAPADAVTAPADAQSYAVYREQYRKKNILTETVVLTGGQAQTLSDGVRREASYEGKEDVLLWEEEGAWAEWTVEVPRAGLYSLKLTYQALPGKGADIEFAVDLNGARPFTEAGDIAFSRIWRDDLEPDEPFAVDSIGNDIVPDKVEVARYNEEPFRDKEGLYDAPYLFYFEKGENVIRLTGVRECAAVAELTLYEEKQPVSYEEYAADVDTAAAASQTIGYSQNYQAERADEYSTTVLTATYDRGSAATEPSSPSVIRRNTLGGSGWAYGGQWAKWTIEVPQDGYYKIALKYKQNFVRGLYTSRSVAIDGEILFDELGTVKFPYSNDWEIKTLGDGQGDFLFYLTAGSHDITIEVVPGDMLESLAALDAVWEQLGDLYQKIVMITGANPDPYFDYDLANDIPNLLTDFQSLAKVLRDQTEALEAVTGRSGSVANTLVQLADQLERFAKKPYSIAPRLEEFRENISALAAWIQSRRQQPLQLDYLTVYSADQEAPTAGGGFFRELWYQVELFCSSFLMDYNNVSGSDAYEEQIEVWIGAGRDQMYILRSLIDSGFSEEYDIGVTLKLVGAAILPQAIMAGIGPDVALDAVRSLPVDMALRGALHPLEGFAGFDEVKERFMSTALDPYTLGNSVYALPQTEIFHMLFYRTDVLSELGLTPPDTWEDMYNMISILQRNNREIGIPSEVSVYYMLLLQKGGSLYNEDGTKTQLDSPEAVEAFEEWCRIYTQYNFSHIKSDLNRFKSGEMPVTIMPYNFYCQLLLAAPEINGLWQMAPLPGTRQEDGTVDRSDSSASSTACVMLADTDHPDAAWTFMDWFTSTEVQAQYGRQIEATLGAASRYTPSNVGAMAGLQWQQEELELLQDQWKNVREIPEMPGAYYIARNLNNAFRAAVFSDEVPRDMLRQWNDEINREITRKRRDYGLPTAE